MENCGKKQSNLQSFLTHTTPLVPIYTLSKTSMQELNRLWQPVGKEKSESFTLSDLWEQYKEWSVYGAGVPLVLSNSENVVQYYAPYLSAIQIYTTKYLASSRLVLEESESDSFSDDSETEKLSKSWDAVSDDSVFDQDGSSPSRDLLGELYFQYIEYDSPYGRIPLVDKINELAKHKPGLLSFKSVEISPASWMSVAWYPIYHIPPQANVKGLSSCFLTYHTISASFQDDNVQMSAINDTHHSSSAAKCSRNKPSGSNYTPLHPFGLATYKLQEKLWRGSGSSDSETLSTLYTAAYSWLRQLQVEHHDFNFFATH